MSRYADHDAVAHVAVKIKKPLGHLGRVLAYIVGASFGGIHNAMSRAQVLKGTWDDRHHAEANIRGNDAATHDHDELTTLVYLAHRFRVRVALHPVAPNVLRVTVLPGLGHIPQIEDPPAFNRALLAALGTM